MTSCLASVETNPLSEQASTREVITAAAGRHPDVALGGALDVMQVIAISKSNLVISLNMKSMNCG